MNFDLNFIKEEKRLDFLVTEKIKNYGIFKYKF